MRLDSRVSDGYGSRVESATGYFSILHGREPNISSFIDYTNRAGCLILDGADDYWWWSPSLPFWRRCCCRRLASSLQILMKLRYANNDDLVTIRFGESAFAVAEARELKIAGYGERDAHKGCLGEWSLTARSLQDFRELIRSVPRDMVSP